VVRPTSIGFLNQGTEESFLCSWRVVATGVMGVLSREGPCDKSLGVGEWRSDGGLSAYSNIRVLGMDDVAVMESRGRETEESSCRGSGRRRSGVLGGARSSCSGQEVAGADGG
jgi:hypothetical protein